MDSEMKEKSKNWTEEEVEVLELSLKKYGTDFHILSTFFPKKTKNQIKVIKLECRISINSWWLSARKKKKQKFSN